MILLVVTMILSQTHMSTRRTQVYVIQQLMGVIMRYFLASGIQVLRNNRCRLYDT